MPPHIILHGDCLAVIPLLPPNSVDLVLADPPYGQTQNDWDKPIDLVRLWPELRRITKPATPIVLTASQPFASHLICSNPTEFRYDLIWQKNKPTGFLNANRQPLRTHEHVLVFYRKAPLYNPQKTSGHEPSHAATRAKKSNNYGTYDTTFYEGGATDRHPTSVLPIPVINNDSPDKVHSTQKPVDLMRYLIRTYTNPGDLVLDFAAGSGTTGVAALMENRRACLIEQKAEYVEIAKRRMAQLI